MDTIHKHEYKLRDLATRAVTLFPARAQVAREIKDVLLKPGVNEITIIGLTPTIDEDSIKVEGTGSAVISDLSVELLPNRELFDDIYPESEEDEDEDEDALYFDNEDDFKPSPQLKEELDALDKEMEAVEDERKLANEIITSAKSRLDILDHHGKEIKLKQPDEIRQNIEVYEKEREKIAEAKHTAQQRIRDIDTRSAKVSAQRFAVQKRIAKERRKAEIAKAKADKIVQKRKDLEARRRAEARSEKDRIRRERERFWPKSVYSVRITLDATAMTPSSSRRSSIASVADLAKQPDPKEPFSPASDLACGLVLTYITDAAFWAPSYDLQLTTTSDKAALLFDAKITNTTSETWSNCKVTLSTSQTTFSGLTDTIPSLTPWHIKLGPRGYAKGGSSSAAILGSVEEQKQAVSYRAEQMQKSAKKPRADLFGVSKSNNVQHPQFNAEIYASNIAPPQQQMQMLAMAPPPAPGAPAPAIARSGFGGAAPRAFSSSMKMSRAAPQAAQRSYAEEADLYGSSASASFDYGGEDAVTVTEAEPELDFQESAVEETGLTTTYDLPGTKTLVPRPAAFKQRVARVALSNVVFSHTIVAKYKPVAYLKARLRNGSPVTILKGRAGLTLDGTFLGQTTLPRCSVGDSFSLSLGIDPAVKVVYPQPEVRRATTGVFSKEDSSVYTRVATVTNTRSAAGGKPVNVVVYDQVPVSEDERLKVDVLHPKGLVVGAGAVGTGTGGGGDGRPVDKDWGRAVATLKKNGEVCWDATVQPGKSARLTLEYVVALPSGESAIQC